MGISLSEFIFRTSLAMLLGLIIGAERQLKGHPAGIRTNVLVCLGSCLFVLYPLLVGGTDISRSAAQVITGVGFLGSGIIFKEGINVRGINTAATIWCTAAVGVLCSSGFIIPATLSSLAILIGNVALKPVSKWLTPPAGYDENDTVYHISIVCGKEQEMEVRQLIIKSLEEVHIALMRLESHSESYSLTVRIAATFHYNDGRCDPVAEGLVQRINQLNNIRQAGWMISEE